MYIFTVPYVFIVYLFISHIMANFMLTLSLYVLMHFMYLILCGAICRNKR